MNDDPNIAAVGQGGPARAWTPPWAVSTGPDGTEPPAPILDTVAFAGDWHGDTTWARNKINDLAQTDIRLLLHVGDFGVWPGPSGRAYLTRLEQEAAHVDLVIAITPGNHEDWGHLSSRTPHDRGDGLGPVIALTDHIVVFPRGARFEVEATEGVRRSFVSLGGAPSIDFDDRIRGKSWWPEEMILDEHVDAVVVGGYADVMIAHDSPDIPYATNGVARIIRDDPNPFGWSREGLAYAAVGRGRMTRAFEGVAPRVFVHGHFHVADRARVRVDRPGEYGGPGECVVISLDQQETPGNTGLLDLNVLGFW